MGHNEFLNYGLKYNPFPIGPAEDLSLSDLVVAKVGQNDIILSDFSRFKDLSNRKFRFIVTGPWGSGKSLISLYYAKILKEAYGDKLLLINIAPTPADIREIVQILIIKLQDNISRGVISSLKKSDISNAWKTMLSAIKNKEYSIVYQQFTDIFRKIVEEESKIIYIRFDQLESAINQCIQDKDAMRRLAEFLRNFSILGEELKRGLAVGMAILDAAWSIFSRSWGSIEGIPVYQLSHLSSLEDVEELILTYLKKARVPKNELPENIAEIIEQNKVYPFTVDALEELLKVSEGRPRYVCRYAHYALAKAVNVGLSEINAELITLIVKPEFKYWLQVISTEVRRDKKFLVSVLTDIFEKARKYFPQFKYSIVTKRMKKSLAEILGITAPATQDGKFVRIPADWLVSKDNEVIAIRIEPRLFNTRKAEELSYLTQVKVDEKNITKILIMTLMDVPLSAMQILSLLRLKGIDVEIRKLRDDPDSLGRILALWKKLRGELPGYLIYEEKLKDELHSILRDILGIL